MHGEIYLIFEIDCQINLIGINRPVAKIYQAAIESFLAALRVSIEKAICKKNYRRLFL